MRNDFERSEICEKIMKKLLRKQKQTKLIQPYIDRLNKYYKLKTMVDFF